MRILSVGRSIPVRNQLPSDLPKAKTFIQKISMFPVSLKMAAWLLLLVRGLLRDKASAVGVSNFTDKRSLRNYYKTSYNSKRKSNQVVQKTLKRLVLRHR